MVKSKWLKLAVICTLIFGIEACSDSGTDAGGDEPPEIPDLQTVTPDFGFFDQNTGTQVNTTTQDGPFTLAQTIVNGTVRPLFSIADFAVPFFTQAQQTEPEFVNGAWEWNYSSSQQGISVDIRLTAQVDENANEVNWDLFISTSGGEFNFDDYNFMSGTSSLDGTSGNWSIFPFEPGGGSTPVITFNWTIDDNDNVTASFSIDDPQSNNSFSIDFTEDGPRHQVEISSTGDQISSIIIFWNSDTNEGFINQNGDVQCWDSNFVATTSCPTGL